MIYLIPVFILGFLLVVMGTMAALSRIAGGKYLRPVFAFLMKVPVLKGLLKRASEKAMERYNPDLAGAVKKLQRAGADKDPMRAQQALSTLNAEERKAWMEAASQQSTVEEQQPVNRAQRRAMERMQKGRMPSPQVKRRAK